MTRAMLKDSRAEQDLERTPRILSGQVLYCLDIIVGFGRTAVLRAAPPGVEADTKMNIDGVFSAATVQSYKTGNAAVSVASRGATPEMICRISECRHSVYLASTTGSHPRI